MSDNPFEDRLRQDAAQWREAGGQGTPNQHERLLERALRRARLRRTLPVTLSATAVAAVIIAVLIGVAVDTSSTGSGPAPAGSSGPRPIPTSTCSVVACLSTQPPPRRTGTLAADAGAGGPTTPAHAHSDHPTSTAHHHRPTPTTSPATSYSTTSPTSPPASTSPSTPSGSPDPTCASTDLELDDGPTTTDTNGISYQTYYLKNLGSAACTLDGYPDVEQMTATGDTAGPAATQDATLDQQQETGQTYPEDPVSLDPSDQAEFTLATNCQSSTPASITQLQVTPPGTDEAIEHPDSTNQYCTQTVGYIIPS